MTSQPEVIILHVPDEEHYAEQIAHEIKSFGYETWCTSEILVGEQPTAEISKRLELGGPVIICGTVRAVGHKWMRTIITAAQASGIKSRGSRVFIAQLDGDADLDRLSLGTKIASCYPTLAVGIKEIQRSLERYFPLSDSLLDEALPSETASDFHDSNLTKIRAYSEALVEKYKAMLRAQVIDEYQLRDLDGEELLTRLGFMAHGRLYAPACLLFLDYPQRLFRTAFIQCVHFMGEGKTAAQDSADVAGSLLDQIQKAVSFVEARIKKVELLEPGVAAARFDFEYPMLCLREIVANAVCHRDYATGTAQTSVRLFSDRIEVVNPGTWACEGVELEDEKEIPLGKLISESHPRNTCLANGFRWVKLAETQGTGIPLAIEDCDQCNADQPVVRREHGKITVKIFPRNDWGISRTDRRGRSIEQKSRRSVKVLIERLPRSGRHFVARQAELRRLNQAWDEANEHVLSIVSWGGVGKTALVNHWLNIFLRKDSNAERVYGWSFYSQGTEERLTSSDTFIDEALRFFGDFNPTAGSARDRGLRLADLIRRQSTLLVLDGIEPLQHPPGPLAGRLKDPALAALVKSLAASNNGLCIITTREPLDDIGHLGNTSAPRLDLEHLTAEAGAELLRHLGVKGTEHELRETADDFGGHPLALSLLGTYLVKVYAGEVRRRNDIPFGKADQRQGGHAYRVMAAYERWLEDREVTVLRLLGLFDRPADADAISALRAAPVIPNLNEALFLPQKHWWSRKRDPVAEDDWQLALSNLRDCGLLAESDGLDAHPLVRAYFGDQLEERHPVAWRAGQLRLYEHFKDAAPERPDTLEEMMPLYAAIVHGCRAGKHKEAYGEVYRPRIRRDNEAYQIHKLGAFGADLVALSSFFVRPWDEPVANLTDDDKAWLLNSAGFELRALGRLTEAVQPMRASLEMRKAEDNPLEASTVAGNLSELYLTLGDVSEAVASAEESVELADESGDDFMRMVNRTTLADALHQAGRLEESAESFREAEAMQADRQPLCPRLYSLQGYRYCDLLLSLAMSPDDVREVRERATEALEIAESNNWLLDVALYHLTLGRAYPALRGATGFAAMAEPLDRSVGGLRQAGTEDHLPRGLLARAALRRETNDLPGAKADLDEAQEIAKRGSMRLHLCDVYLGWTRWHLASGGDAEARRYLGIAKGLVEQCGYRRREREIGALEGRLGEDL